MIGFARNVSSLSRCSILSVRLVQLLDFPFSRAKVGKSGKMDQIDYRIKKQSIKDHGEVQIIKFQQDRNNIQTKDQQASHVEIHDEKSSQQQYQYQQSINKGQKKLHMSRSIKELYQSLESRDFQTLLKKMKNSNSQNAIIFENQAHQNVIMAINNLSLKQLSIFSRQYVQGNKKQNHTYYQLVWKEIQNSFLLRFQQSTDPVEIRKFASIFYCLSKVKTSRNSPYSTVTTSASSNLQNYQTKFAVLLPFASHQSFTMIAVSLSRMGPLSVEFAYILQKLYYQKYDEFTIRQKIQINYTLTKNGRKVDKNLTTNISDKMNLNEIVILLRCNENSGLLENDDNGLLKKAEHEIIVRKGEMNVIDLGEICRIYFAATVNQNNSYTLGEKLQATLLEIYLILRQNINEITFSKIWENFPEVVNRGYLSILFVEEVIKTLQILKKKNEIPGRVWKTMRKTFSKFENLEIKKRLQKIKSID